MNNQDDRTQSYVVLIKSTIVGHYRIVEKIGAGGMGEVYLAEDTELDRTVALKFLPQNLCQDSICRARFRREAQAAAKLIHPNIITIHEVNEYSGRPYFVMEHIEGESLADFIKKRDHSIESIIELSIQICEGLNKAHQSGVVHRDIKPSNILIDKEGRAKILDFGLAAIEGDKKLTKTGSTLGTLHYMSPEQTRGDEVDQRSDIFSFGVVLYEMITSQLPFKGDHEPAIIYSICNEEPEPIARFKSGVSEELQRIVSKTLEKDRSLRYQHCDEIISDLRALQLTRRGRKSAKRLVIPLLIAGAVVIAGIFAAMFFIERHEHSNLSKRLAVLPFKNLGDPANEYLSDGITEELIGKLCFLNGLKVISRTSCFTFKNTTQTTKQIAEALSADYIVEGSLRTINNVNGKTLSINVNVVDTHDDEVLANKKYDISVEGVMDLESIVANEILAAIQISFEKERIARVGNKATNNSVAYDSYLRSVQLAHSDPTESNLRSQIAELELAVSLDPMFGLAYARLADAYANLNWYGIERSGASLTVGETYLRKALAVSPNDPGVRLTYASWLSYELDSAEVAEDEYDRIIHMQPSNAVAYRNRALANKVHGKLQQAALDLKTAAELDPINPDIWNELSLVYRLERSYEFAFQCARKVVRLAAPNDVYYQVWIANHHITFGDTTGCRQVIERFPASEYKDVIEITYLLFIYERRFGEAIEWLQKTDITDIAGQAWFRPKEFLLAQLHSWNGDNKAAIKNFYSARVLLEETLRKAPKDARIWADLGIVCAALGDTAQAIQCASKQREFWDKAFTSLGQRICDQACILALLGRKNDAIAKLDTLLTMPSWWTAHDLKLDPRFDPLRGNPRFQDLIRKYEERDEVDVKSIMEKNIVQDY